MEELTRLNSSQVLTAAAFDGFRSLHPLRAPDLTKVNNRQELDRMPDDELQFWTDGEAALDLDPVPPMLEDDDAFPTHLWVIRADDVVYSPERCGYGEERPSGRIKHTNLTGGDQAHSGGELRFLGENTVAVNGFSGRYGPKDEEELQHVVDAFSRSGYRVFWTGYDADTAVPLPLVGVELRLVA